MRRLARTSFTRLAPIAAWALATVAAAAPPHPGFVDPAPLLGFRNDERGFVQVNLPQPIFRLTLAFLERNDPDLAALIEGLDSVRMIHMGVSESDRREATDAARRLLADLSRQGWESLATVADGGDRVEVLVRVGSEHEVDGVVVLALENGGSSLTFVNLAGTVDVARLGEIVHAFQSDGFDLGELELGEGEGEAEQR